MSYQLPVATLIQEIYCSYHLVNVCKIRSFVELVTTPCVHTARSKMPFARRDPAAPASGGQVLPTGDFDQGTMYRSSFVPKEIGVPEQFRPTVRTGGGRGPWGDEKQFRPM